MKSNRLFAMCAGIALLAGWVGADVIYSNSFTGASEVSPSDTAEVDPGLSTSIVGTALDGNGHLVSVNAVAGSRFIVELSSTPLTADQIKLTWTMRATEDTKWLGVGFLGEDANLKLNDAGSNSGPWVNTTGSATVLNGGSSVLGSKNAWSGTHSAGDILTYELVYYRTSNTIDLSLNGLSLADGVALVHEYPDNTVVSPSIRFLEMQIWVEGTDDVSYVDSIVVETIPEPAPVGLVVLSGAVIFALRRMR